MRNAKMRSKSDMDSVTVFRLIKGRLTWRRYKTLFSYCRKNTFHSRCGCEHDCCGHEHSRYMELTHNPVTNKTLITQTFNYNY